MKNKSGGVDNINAKILKILSEHISVPLEYIFNLCIVKSIWPDALKNAEVVPIYKTGENFKNALSENFLKLYGNETRGCNLVYSIICETLIGEGYETANLPSMPQLVVNNHIEDTNELHNNLADMANRQYNMLNSDKKEIFDKIL